MDDTISNLYVLAKNLTRENIEKTMSVQSTGVPEACRERALNGDDKRIHNEQKSWIESLNESLPIWSRVKYFNCVGVERHTPGSKENHYDIEIPQRLLSLWGNLEVHKSIVGKMEKYQGYHYVCNVLAICACLKYNIDRWTPVILDNIIKTSSKIYPEMLRKRKIADNGFRIEHINNTYKFEDSKFDVTLHQAAVGSPFIAYGLNEFNLARALSWFFKTYQFGLLKCLNRCLAFGYAVGIDQGYFMYDCQSSGLPLFRITVSNSYVLRTNHLQILLYCMIVSLRISQENERFTIYNVDAREIESHIKTDTTSSKAKLKTSLYPLKFSNAKTYANTKVNTKANTKVFAKVFTKVNTNANTNTNSNANVCRLNKKSAGKLYNKVAKKKT